MRVNRLPPRNPWVVPARMRKAGAHGKTEKALRRADRMAMQAALRQAPEDDSTSETGNDTAVPRGTGKAPITPTLSQYRAPRNDAQHPAFLFTLSIKESTCPSA